MVAPVQQVNLVQDLPGVLHEFLPVVSQDHALAGAGQDGDAHVLFQLLDGIGEGRLGNKELLGGLGHAAAFDDFFQITQLLNSHFCPPIAKIYRVPL